MRSIESYTLFLTSSHAPIQVVHYARQHKWFHRVCHETYSEAMYTASMEIETVRFARVNQAEIRVEVTKQETHIRRLEQIRVRILCQKKAAFSAENNYEIDLDLNRREGHGSVEGIILMPIHQNEPKIGKRLIFYKEIKRS